MIILKKLFMVIVSLRRWTQINYLSSYFEIISIFIYLDGKVFCLRYSILTMKD